MVYLEWRGKTRFLLHLLQFLVFFEHNLELLIELLAGQRFDTVFSCAVLDLSVRAHDIESAFPGSFGDDLLDDPVCIFSNVRIEDSQGSIRKILIRDLWIRSPIKHEDDFYLLYLVKY